MEESIVFLFSPRGVMTKTTTLAIKMIVRNNYMSYFEESTYSLPQ
jgi:hypothetical protein